MEIYKSHFTAMTNVKQPFQRGAQVFTMDGYMLDDL